MLYFLFTAAALILATIALGFARILSCPAPALLQFGCSVARGRRKIERPSTSISMASEQRRA